VIAFFIVAACVCVMIIIRPVPATERYWPTSDETVSRNQTGLNAGPQEPASSPDAPSSAEPSVADGPQH
jgi:hypothetical protein